MSIQQPFTPYAEVMNRAATLTAHGRPVILDGSWTADAARHQAMDLAARTTSVVVPLRCGD